MKANFLKKAGRELKKDGIPEKVIRETVELLKNLEIP